MGRTLDYCQACLVEEVGYGAEPPCLCDRCAKKYPWAIQECENAYHAGWAAGHNHATARSRAMGR